MLKRKVFLSAILIMTLLAFACAGIQSVKPYEVGKVTAETILYDARILQNKGYISEYQFNQIRNTYDKLKKAQDIAIDARKAWIAFDTAETKLKARKALDEVLNLSFKLVSLAQDLGIMKGDL